MKRHPKGGFVDASGDRYVVVGRELRKLGKDDFEPRHTHSEEARAFQDRAGWEAVEDHSGASKMTAYSPVSSIPKDGTWVLIRGRNSVGAPMIPVVAAFKPPGAPSARGWVDSGTFKPVDDLVAYGEADWAPLPA